MAEDKNEKNVKEQEMVKKKEKFLTWPKKEQNTKTQPPLLLLALILALGLLAGYAINIINTPQTPIETDNTDTNTVNDVSYRTVPITMIYTFDCTSCRQTNTIEELFIVRQIPYSIKKVEASSEEGKKILERFPSIDTLPTAIIDTEKIKFYPTTKLQFDNVLTQENNAYIAPELNLNENTYYPIYYLEKATGFCNNDKPTIVEFDDYYTLENAKARASFYDFMDDFNKVVDYKYVFAQSESKDTNSIMTNLFLTCAGEQGKFIEMEKQITGIYCNNPFAGDETILTSPEILGCWTISNHFGKSLAQTELDHALGRIDGIDTNTFKTCIDNREVLLTNAEQVTKELHITKTPPGGLFLLDCRETTSITLLKETLCNSHTDLEACSEEST
ncbi:MAG TPA: hypothetical protein VFF13_06830 [archaeon]|nr:hypothetical protein [archaeon]